MHLIVDFISGMTDSYAVSLQRDHRGREIEAFLVSLVAYEDDWLFYIYKDAVTEKFLNQLMDGTFDENIILGVEANGEGTVQYSICYEIYGGKEE